MKTVLLIVIYLLANIGGGFLGYYLHNKFCPWCKRDGLIP